MTFMEWSLVFQVLCLAGNVTLCTLTWRISRRICYRASDELRGREPANAGAIINSFLEQVEKK